MTRRAGVGAAAGILAGLALAVSGLGAPPEAGQAVRGPFTHAEPTVHEPLARFCTPRASARPLRPPPVARAGGRSLVGPTTDFAGISEAMSPAHIGFGGDISGAIGPSSYVQTINDAIGIFSRSGALLCKVADTNALWAGDGGPCDNVNVTYTDAIVLYDRQAGRWFVSRFMDTGSAWYQCVAVSKSEDPTAGWYRYAFPTGWLQADHPSYDFPDYPKFGVWPGAYAMTANAKEGNSVVGIMVLAFERSAMIAGRDARFVEFFVPALPGHSSTLQPASADGSIPPPAGAPDYLAQPEDDDLGWPADRLAIWALHADWAKPAASTLAIDSLLEPVRFDSNPCSNVPLGASRACIAQPPGPNGELVGLDPLIGTSGFRLVYRNLAKGGQALVLAQTATAGKVDHLGILWYELRRAAGAAHWQIRQEGTFAPDGESRWLPSPGIDRAGDIALGYVTSGADLFPSVRFAGRAASDPLGTLPRSEGTLAEGAGAELDNSLFGDYTQMTIDPRDDCTFWYTAPYYTASSTSHDFSTVVGAFRFSGCPG